MAQRLKSWESPRRSGRNNKGKGGSARARQIKKRDAMLIRKLKEDIKETRFVSKSSKTKSNKTNKRENNINSLSLFLLSSSVNKRFYLI